MCQYTNGGERVNYFEFLAAREQLPDMGGFIPGELPSHLFDYQAQIVDWAVRQGRGGIFADCGLGKTPMSLAWAEQVHLRTGKPVLLLTPLAVGQQIVAEAGKFGHDAEISRNGTVTASITVTNYEQLDKFDPGAFGGVVCDESSILKSFDGATKAAVTEFMRRIQYRLLATATAAPNDYTELGTASEALGGLGYMDMLTRFFINKDRKQSSRGGRVMRWEMSDRVGLDRPGTWRLKGHAEEAFWQSSSPGPHLPPCSANGIGPQLLDIRPGVQRLVLFTAPMVTASARWAQIPARFERTRCPPVLQRPFVDATLPAFERAELLVRFEHLFPRDVRASRLGRRDGAHPVA